MDLRQHMSRLSGKMTKERWLFLLFIGVVLMILSFPVGKGRTGGFLTSAKKTSGASAVEIRGADNSSALAGQIPQTAQIAGQGMHGGGGGGGGNMGGSGGGGGNGGGGNGGGGSGGGGGNGGGSGSGSNGSGLGSGNSGGNTGGNSSASVLPGNALSGTATEDAQAASTRAGGESAYEVQLEARVKEILSHVDGVGKVDVMIVLKSSEEKVLRVDRNASISDTNEKDSQGGTRSAKSSQTQESTVLTGGGSGQGSVPFVEKELRPEISGIVISATGGGSPTVKAEISAAMEALFDLPPHKIKVLKRVE